MPRWPRVSNSAYVEVKTYIRIIQILIRVANHQFDSVWGLLLQAYNACVLEHLKCWQHLAHQCARDNIFLFRLRPKGHYHQQMGRDVERTRLNPRLVMSCMYDESFLGHIKRIAKACHSWTMVKERFWQRYLLLLSLRFEERRSCSRWALKAGVPGSEKRFCSITTAEAAPTTGDVTDNPFFAMGWTMCWKNFTEIPKMGVSPNHLCNGVFHIYTPSICGYTLNKINTDSSIFGQQSLT